MTKDEVVALTERVAEKLERAPLVARPVSAERLERIKKFRAHLDRVREQGGDVVETIGRSIR
jgi:hypothetical protein